MLILLDTANLEGIRKLNDMYPIDGITTNPSIIVKEKTNFIDLIKEIRSIIGTDKMLHVQTLGTTALEIVEEAEYLNEKIGGNFYVKIPVTDEGIKAMKILKEKNIKVSATSIITALQGLIAAKAGAEYVIPYVNRIDNISGDGVGVVSEMVCIFEAYGFKTKVLAASFKNVDQIKRACLAGTHAITAAQDIITQLLQHPLTDWSVEQFTKDWENMYGKGKRTNNI